MQELKNELARILSANLDNRLSQELILGLTVRIGAVFEPHILERDKLREQARANQESAVE